MQVFYRWGQSDATLLLNKKFKTLVQMGILSGGVPAIVAAQLKISLPPWVAMGLDGLMAREDNLTLQYNVAPNQTQLLVLYLQEANVGTPQQGIGEPTSQVLVMTQAVYNAHPQKNWLVRFCRFTTDAVSVTSISLQPGLDRDVTDTLGYGSWRAPVVNAAALPPTAAGNKNGDVRVALDTKYIWCWDSALNVWQTIGETMSLQDMHYAEAISDVWFRHISNSVSGFLGGVMTNAPAASLDTLSPSRSYLDFPVPTNVDELDLYESHWLINGNFLKIPGQTIALPAHPGVGERFDLLYLEVWPEVLAGEPDAETFYKNDGGLALSLDGVHNKEQALDRDSYGGADSYEIPHLYIYRNEYYRLHYKFTVLSSLVVGDINLIVLQPNTITAAALPPTNTAGNNYNMHSFSDYGLWRALDPAVIGGYTWALPIAVLRRRDTEAPASPLQELLGGERYIYHCYPVTKNPAGLSNTVMGVIRRNDRSRALTEHRYGTGFFGEKGELTGGGANLLTYPACSLQILGETFDLPGGNIDLGAAPLVGALVNCVVLEVMFVDMVDSGVAEVGLSTPSTHLPGADDVQISAGARRCVLAYRFVVNSLDAIRDTPEAYMTLHGYTAVTGKPGLYSKAINIADDFVRMRPQADTWGFQGSVFAVPFAAVPRRNQGAYSHVNYNGGLNNPYGDTEAFFRETEIVDLRHTLYTQRDLSFLAEKTLNSIATRQYKQVLKPVFSGASAYANKAMRSCRIGTAIGPQQLIDEVNGARAIWSEASESYVWPIIIEDVAANASGPGWTWTVATQILDIDLDTYGCYMPQGRTYTGQWDWEDSNALVSHLAGRLWAGYTIVPGPLVSFSVEYVDLDGQRRQILSNGVQLYEVSPHHVPPASADENAYCGSVDLATGYFWFILPAAPLPGSHVHLVYDDGAPQDDDLGFPDADRVDFTAPSIPLVPSTILWGGVDAQQVPLNFLDDDTGALTGNLNSRVTIYSANVINHTTGVLTARTEPSLQAPQFCRELLGVGAGVVMNVNTLLPRIPCWAGGVIVHYLDGAAGDHWIYTDPTGLLWGDFDGGLPFSWDATTGQLVFSTSVAVGAATDMVVWYVGDYYPWTLWGYRYVDLPIFAQHHHDPAVLSNDYSGAVGWENSTTIHWRGNPLTDWENMVIHTTDDSGNPTRIEMKLKNPLAAGVALIASVIVVFDRSATDANYSGNEGIKFTPEKIIKAQDVASGDLISTSRLIRKVSMAINAMSMTITDADVLAQHPDLGANVMIMGFVKARSRVTGVEEVAVTVNAAFTSMTISLTANPFGDFVDVWLCVEGDDLLSWLEFGPGGHSVTGLWMWGTPTVTPAAPVAAAYRRGFHPTNTLYEGVPYTLWEFNGLDYDMVTGKDLNDSSNVATLSPLFTFCKDAGNLAATQYVACVAMCNPIGVADNIDFWYETTMPPMLELPASLPNEGRIVGITKMFSHDQGTGLTRYLGHHGRSPFVVNNHYGLLTPRSLTGVYQHSAEVLSGFDCWPGRRDSMPPDRFSGSHSFWWPMHQVMPFCRTVATGNTIRPWHLTGTFGMPRVGTLQSYNSVNDSSDKGNPPPVGAWIELPGHWSAEALSMIRTMQDAPLTGVHFADQVFVNTLLNMAGLARLYSLVVTPDLNEMTRTLPEWGLYLDLPWPAAYAAKGGGQVNDDLDTPQIQLVGIAIKHNLVGVDLPAVVLQITSGLIQNGLYDRFGGIYSFYLLEDNPIMPDSLA